MTDLPILQKTYDLIQWYIPILDRLPRSHRFALGARIIQHLYDLLEGLIIARYQANKLADLLSLNTKLEILRYQSRLLLDFQLISVERYEYAVKLINAIGRYLRYVDDFALFSNDKQVLIAAKPKLEEYLATLRIKIHPNKTKLLETSQGMNFLGFRILPDRLRVRNDNLRKGRRRLKDLKIAYLDGRISREDVDRSLQSWFAHLAHANTWHLRQQILAELDWIDLD